VPGFVHEAELMLVDGADEWEVLMTASRTLTRDEQLIAERLAWVRRETNPPR
jgi:hypothetical protein